MANLSHTGQQLDEAITKVLNGYTDTSDATATPEDISLGKTAYVKGAKVTGNATDITHAHTYLKVADTRTENPTPLQLMEQLPRQMKELKRNTTIGLTQEQTGHPYVVVDTFIGWRDGTGGYPYRIAYCQNSKIYIQIGLNDNTWGAWKEIGSNANSNATDITFSPPSGMTATNVDTAIKEVYNKVSSNDVVLSAGFRVIENFGSLSTTTNSIGTIKITLPVSWNRTMQNYTISINDMETNAFSKIYLSCYNYNTTSAWIWTNCEIVGKRPRIRLAHDATNCCILIGETTSKWNYTTINIDKVELSFEGQSDVKWLKKSTVSLITDEAGITGIVNVVGNPLLSENVKFTPPSGMTSNNVDGAIKEVYQYAKSINDKITPASINGGQNMGNNRYVLSKNGGATQMTISKGALKEPLTIEWYD